MMTTAQDRIVALTGGHNFRDIGGYSTKDGQTVAWGKVYRSGTMVWLTDEDNAALRRLGINVICDFRSSTERRNRPSRLAPDTVRDVWSRNYDTSSADLIRAMAQADANPTQSRQLMIEIYRTLAYEQADSYRELFRRIAAGDTPLVFHCSAGKDRTGIAAALLLELLGVPRETVIEDYVMTDLFFERGITMIKDDPGARRLHNIDQTIWAPMMRADQAYIDTFFETTDTKHGSSEGFLRDVIGLTDTSIVEIRRHLLV